MQIKSLELNQFRNYQHIKLHLNPHFNLFIGKNAQGKTNLIEAIYYLGYLHSFRTTKRNDLVNSQANEAVIKSEIEANQVCHEIVIGLDGKKRQIKLNQKNPKIYQEYYGLIPILLFEPKDVYLFRESPSVRRKFINRALALQSPEILKTIRDYEKTIIQKNRLLKEFNSNLILDQLQAWNQQIINLGSEIIFYRRNWIEQINRYLQFEYQELSKTDDKVFIFYQPSFAIDQNVSLEEIKEIFSDQLVLKQNIEIARRESIIGPHRDDWEIQNNSSAMGQFGSQGENRSGIIALKSAQIKIFEEKYQKFPIYLLDDVASELDENRKKALYDRLSTMDSQVFLSTTTPKDLSEVIVNNSHSFLVEKGQISMINS